MILYCLIEIPTVVIILFAAKWLLPEGHTVNQYVRAVLPPLSTGVYLLFFNIRLSVQLTSTLPAHRAGTVRFMLMTHSSSLDFMVVTTGFWLVHRFFGSPICIVKKELLNMPYMGWLQRGAGSIPVERAGNLEAAKKSLAVAEERGKEGYIISGFPEGTRRRTPSVGREQIQPMKKGLFHVAKNLQTAGQKIAFVPLVIIGGNSAWPSQYLFPKTGSKITIRYGDPVSMKENETVDEITNRMRTTLQDGIELAGAVLPNGSYSTDAAFEQGMEIDLWKCFGFEAVLMAVPGIVVLALALTGNL